MTVWELAACVDGYNAVHGGEQEPEPPSIAEYEEMRERHRAIVTLH
jgi:hypothetical protein